MSGIIRRYRQQICCPWRKLTSGRQALLVLACLRKGETFAELAAGFGIGTAGHAYVVIDGTLYRSTGSPRTGRSTLASTAATG